MRTADLLQRDRTSTREELTYRPRGRRDEPLTERDCGCASASGSCIQTRLESRTMSMTIRSKIFVTSKSLLTSVVPPTRLSYGVWRMVLFPPAPQGSRSSRVACARPPPAVPARPVVARSSPGLPRLPRRRLFDSCTHITPGHPPHTAVACPMCRMRHVGLGRALSYRSSCTVPQSSNSIEAGPWTELRSPPAVLPCAMPMDHALRPPRLAVRPCSSPMHVIQGSSGLIRGGNAGW